MSACQSCRRKHVLRDWNRISVRTFGPAPKRKKTQCRCPALGTPCLSFVWSQVLTLWTLLRTLINYAHPCGHDVLKLLSSRGGLPLRLRATRPLPADPSVVVRRRLFPTLRVCVGGLVTSRNYVLLVDVMPVDQFRYRYEYSTWFISGTDNCRYSPSRDRRPAETENQVLSRDDGRHLETTPPARCYVHADSPATGEHWMRQSVVSFHRLKLTNNIHDQHGNVCSSHTKMCLVAAPGFDDRGNRNGQF